MFEIIHTNTEITGKDDFVAIGSYLNHDGVPGHSLFIINFRDEVFAYHYTGDPQVGILLEPSYYERCFHKVTKTIDPRLIPSFIIMCRRIMGSASPRYGYFYSGEYFDKEGNHFSDKEIGETMTCAGFLLNVLKGFLELDYLVYEDWNGPSYPTEKYVEEYAAKYNLDPATIAESHRRISPLELLCSAFYTLLPIRKNQIDLKVDETQEYLKNYF